MSKLLTGMMEAERKRQQFVVDGSLTSAAVIDVGCTAAVALANERLEAEKAAEVVLDGRIEEETAALEEARRNERLAAELAAAAAARAAKDAELTRLTAERAAAERCAADRAAAQLQAELSAEAAARARAIAEEEARQQTRRRIEREAEASRVATQRLRSQRTARAEQTSCLAAEAASDAGSVGETEDATRLARARATSAAAPVASHRYDRLLSRWGRLIMAVMLSMGIGVTAGFWLGVLSAKSPGEVEPLPVAERARKAPAVVDEDVPHLRLDHELGAKQVSASRNSSRNP